MQANPHLLRDLLGSRRMADEVAQSLADWKCVCFGLPGDAVNPLVDAIRRAGVRYVHVRHETTAAYAALAASVLSGGPAACVAATGPGATHLAPGLVEAARQRAAVVAVAGMVPLELEGSRSFQELDLERCLPTGTFVASARARVPAHGVLAAEMIAAALQGRLPAMLGVSAVALLGPPSGVQTSVFALAEPALDAAALRGAAAALAGSPVRWVVGRSCPRSVVSRLLAQRQRVVGLPEALGSYPRGTPVWGSGASRPLPGEVWVGLGEETASMERALAQVTDRVFCPGGLGRPGALVARRVLGPLPACVDALLPAAARGGPASADDSVPPARGADLAGAVDALLDANGAVCVDRQAWAVELAEGLPRRGRRLLHTGQDEGHGGALGLAIGAAFSGRAAVAVLDEAGLLDALADLATLAKYALPVTVLVVGPASLDVDALASSLGVGAGKLRVVRAPGEPPERLPCRPPRDDGPRVLVAAIRGLGAEVVGVGAHPALRELRLAAGPGPGWRPEAAAMAASATAKATGRVAVVALHAEAESLRAMNGLVDAAYDRAGVLALRVGDTLPLTPVVEGARVSTLAGRAPLDQVLAQALGHAAAEGYGELHATVDELGRFGTGSARAPAVVPPLPVLVPSAAAVAAATAAVRGARAPVVVAGRGAVAAARDVRLLADRLGAPLVLSLPARGAFTLREPGVAGGLGSSGHRPAHQALGHADLALVLGCSSRGNAFGPVPVVPSVRVDQDARVLARSPGLPVHGSAEGVVAALAPSASAAPGRRERASARLASFFAARDHSGPLGLTPPQVCAEVDRALEGSTTPVCLDVGLNTLWSFRFVRGARLVSTGNFGTMGFAVPAALALAREGQPALALSGDGGALMAIGALAGARVPAVVLVMNNGALDAIRWEMLVNGLAEHETSLGPVDFVTLARALGCRAERVVDRDGLREALRRALGAGQPYLLDVHANRNYMPSPVAIHPRQALGFAVGLVRDLWLRARGWARSPRRPDSDMD